MTIDNNNNNHHIEYYQDLVITAAKNVQIIVCERNNISLNPKSGLELCPIPVYEDGKYNLLSHANEIGSAEIMFPLNNYEYLPAYYKKTKQNDIEKIKIVVVTSNYCEARFFAAKELMHCYIQDNGISATNSIDKINRLIQNLSANLRINPESIADEVAWIGASYYLIPEEWVPLLKNIRNEIIRSSPDDSNNAYLHIAQLLRAPEIVVRIRLEDARNE